MGPEGIILVNPPITTLQQSLTHSAMCKTLHYKYLVQHILKQIYATTPVGAHPLPVDELRSYFLFGTEILRKHKTFWETFH